MFTGLIEQVGTIKRKESLSGDVRLVVNAQQPNPYHAESNAIGASIAINGVCLTVVEHKRGGNEGGGCEWAFDVSIETLERSSLKALDVGSRVNMEWSLTLNKPMGGHWVSGHVDGVGEVLSHEPSARATVWTLKYPNDLAPFIAEKGSICLDGISLTVNRVGDGDFDVTIIPHTQACTTIQHWHVGDPVNIEVDMMARYLYRFMQTRTDSH